MKRKNFFIFFCFAALITSILSPMASNHFVRKSEVHDLIPHIAHVIQAKAALDEGQFPVRTAPLMYSHYGYPVFQFYNSFLYTVIGGIYKWVTPQNPYIALKLFIWLALLLSCIFFYKLILEFVQSETIAFLAAVVYIMSPYMLINLFERAAIPEAIGEALIPIVIFYNFKVFYSENRNISYVYSSEMKMQQGASECRVYKREAHTQARSNDAASSFPMSIVIAAISWFALAGTHILTFIYFSLFFGAFLFLLTIFNPYPFKNLMWVGVSYLYGLILGSFFVIPIVLFTKYTSMQDSIGMGGFQFESLLPTLLSLIPTSPMPLPGNGRIASGMKLYLSIGIPTLFSLGIIFYLLFIAQKFLAQKFKTFAAILLGLFLLSFCAAWTPFDFWPYLPKILQSAQFTWRLLTQTMWLGAMLFSIAILGVFGRNLDIRYAMIGLFLICISVKPWITSQQVGSVAVSEIVQNPDLGYGRSTYLVNPDTIMHLKEPITVSVADSTENCYKEKNKTLCHLNITPENAGIVQIPVFYYPQMIDLKVNGKYAHYFPAHTLGYVFVGLKLSPGTYNIESYFRGVPIANWLSVCGWVCVVAYLIFISFHKMKKGLSRA